MIALNELTLCEMSTGLADGSIKAVELLQSCLAQIESTADLNTFVVIDQDRARQAARESDERHKQGAALSRLDGIPIALKDNHMTMGVPTTAASKMLDGFVSPYDATVTRKLKEAGAVIIGKTSMDEFAMGSSNEHSAFGAVKNPWDKTRVPGGSSGGSAAAVAARQVPGSFGTDTGGSIRQPAALCGVYGLKPTYGRVSRQGIIAFASSLDQVGPFARNPKDLALLLQTVAGHDPDDSTSVDEAVPDYEQDLDAGIEGMRIGLPGEYFVEGLDPEIEQAIQDTAERLRKLGAEIREISLPHTKYALSTYYLIATAEASSNLARFDGVRYGLRVDDKDLRGMIARSRAQGFGEEVQRRIMLGTYVLSAGYYDAYYGKAQKVRTLIRRDFENAFNEVDVILTPTSPVTAFRRGERLDDPLAMYLADVCTLAVNLAGVPGLNVPAGLSKEGLPIGAQFIGQWFDESRLLGLAQSLEAASAFGQARPPVG
jgi:aspartyl-tRNA(Asn)/glutamyl-tRNA(Gln) amidotransferase subunit A